MGRLEDRSVNPFPEAPADAEVESESESESELAVPDALLGRVCEPRLHNLVRNPETPGMIGLELGAPSLRFPAAAVEPLSNETVAAAAAALLEDSRDLASASGRCSDFSASNSEKDSNTGSGDQDPSLKVRLMCSMGGEILLRPGDGKLRHVGGETKIVSVTRRICLGGLMARLTSLYGRAVGSIKYQAAGGGLDALVSVASDADVEVMMEDYQRLSAGGGVSRLRLFLSPPSNLLDTPSMHKSGGGGGVLQSPSHMKQNGTFKLTVEPPIIRNPHLSTTLDNSAENKHEACKAQINRLSPSSTENPFFGTVSLANNEEGSRHGDPCLSSTLDNCIQNKCEPYQAQIKRLLPSSTEDPFFGTVSLANNEEGSRHGDPPHLSTTLDNSVEIKHETSKAPIDRLSPSSAGNSFSGTVSLQNNEEGSRHEDPHLSANLDNSVKNKHEPYESQIDRLLSSSVVNPFLGTVSLQANEGGGDGDPHLSTSLDNAIKNKHKPYEAQIDRLASSSTENPFFGTVSLPNNEEGSRHGDPHLSTTIENSVKNKHKPYEAQIDRLSSSSPGNPFLGSVSLQNNDEGSRHGDCHLSTSLDNSVEIKRLSSCSLANPFLGTISLPNNEEGSRHGSGHGDPHLFTSLENSVETKQEPYEARIDRLSFSSVANPFLGTISLQDGEEGSRNVDPHRFTSLENSIENKHEPYKAQIDGLSSSSTGNPFLLATVSLQDDEKGSEHESRDGSSGHGDPHLFTSKENSVENKQEEGCKAWMDGLSSCLAGNPFLGTVCLQDDEEGLRNGRGHWDFLQQKKKPESVENSTALLSLLSGTDGGDQTYRENWLASNCMDSMENNQGSAKQVLPLPSLEESYTFPSVNPQRRTSLNEEPMSFSPFNGSSSSLSWGLPDIPLTETAQLISFDNAKSIDSTLWNSKLSLDELLGLTVNPPGETSLPELDKFGSGHEKEEKIATNGNSSVDFFSIQMEGASGAPYYREGKAIGGIDLNLLPPTECSLAVADSLKSRRATGGGREEEEAARASLDSMNASNVILSERNKGEPIFPVFDSLLAGEEQELWLKQQVGVPDSNGRSSRIPTLSIQNWDKMLTQTETEEVIVDGELSDAASDDFKTDLGSEKEDNSDELLVDETETMNSVPGDLAARAEEEAIARGLQTIKNIDLEEQRELGSGTFGTVYHGKWRGTDVAIKRLKSSCFTGRASERDRLMADFWREAIILSQLHHPNVVAFYGVVTDGPDGTLATINEYMVNGSLKQVLRRKDRSIDRRKRLLIAMDAAFGMEYLHGKRIVHFDLKCENLLVNMRDPQRPICKVGDLGLSKIKQQTMVSGGVRGTLPWMAPELLNGSSSLVSEKVDVYSFGIVMWELLTGKEPYANMHYGAIIGGIVNNTLRPPIPSSCDPAWRSLMQRSWSADLAERPSFSEIAAELRLMADSLQPRGRAQA